MSLEYTDIPSGQGNPSDTVLSERDKRIIRYRQISVCTLQQVAADVTRYTSDPNVSSLIQWFANQYMTGHMSLPDLAIIDESGVCNSEHTPTLMS